MLTGRSPYRSEFRASRLALVGTALTLVAACGAASSKAVAGTAKQTVSGSGSASGAVLVRADEPPANPPAMTIDGVEVPVLSLEWWSRTRHTTTKSYPSDHFRLDGLPRIPVPDGPVTLSIVASALPERFEIKLFDTISGDVPTGERHSIECTQLCGTLVGGNAVTLRIKVSKRTKVAVLMLFWAVPLDQARPQSPVAAYDYASYAFRPASLP